MLDCQELSGHWVVKTGELRTLHCHQLRKSLSIDVAGLVVLCKVDCDLGSKTATTSTSLLCDLYFYDSWPYGLYRTVFLGNVRKWPYLGQLNFCVKTSISSRTSYFWDFYNSWEILSQLGNVDSWSFSCQRLLTIASFRQHLLKNSPHSISLHFWFSGTWVQFSICLA